MREVAGTGTLGRWGVAARDRVCTIGPASPPARRRNPCHAARHCCAALCSAAVSSGGPARGAYARVSFAVCAALWWAACNREGIARTIEAAKIMKKVKRKFDKSLKKSVATSHPTPPTPAAGRARLFWPRHACQSGIRAGLGV